jgi:hypothetical protein
MGGGDAQILPADNNFGALGVRVAQVQPSQAMPPTYRRCTTIVGHWWYINYHRCPTTVVWGSEFCSPHPVDRLLALKK